MTTLHFLGAAGTVTGSAYLLMASGGALLVDCGLFQGPDPEATRAIGAGRDWHNDYAEAALALRRALVEAPDDDARRALLAHVRAVLGVPARPA